MQNPGEQRATGPGATLDDDTSEQVATMAGPPPATGGPTMGGPGGRPGFSPRGMLITLLPNVILPWAIYQLLTGWGVATLNALIATAVVPLTTSLYQLVKNRRVDALGVMTLAFVVVGIVTSFISGDPIFYLVKESFLTGVWGVIMLGSLMMARPLTFYFGRQFMGGSDPARAAFYDQLWDREATFRSFQRWLTILWGVALLGEALLRIVLVYSLPISVFLVVSPAMGIGVTAGLLLLTAIWGKRLGQGIRERRAREREAVGPPT